MQVESLIVALSCERDQMVNIVASPVLTGLNSNGKRTALHQEKTTKDHEKTYWGHSELSRDVICKLQTKARVDLGDQCLSGQNLSPGRAFSTTASAQLQSHEGIVLGQQVACSRRNFESNLEFFCVGFSF